MKLLLVEDEEAIRRFLGSAFHELNLGIGVSEAYSRDSALAALRRDEYDFILCDLKIPSQDGGLDGDVQHGLAVFDAARDIAWGTPIRLLTAFGRETLDPISTRLAESPTEDVFGTRRRVPMARYFGKEDFRPCIEEVRAAAEELRSLELIEIVESDDSQLTSGHKAVLRTFARRNDGTLMKVNSLGGGLSTAKTLKAHVFDEREATRALVVSKIDELAAIQDERLRYERHVVPLLMPGSFAPYVDEVIAGAGRTGGLFYRLAEGHDRNLFETLGSDQALATSTVSKIERLEEPWRSTVHARRRTVREMRSAFVTDEEMDRYGILLRADWQTFESRAIQIREMIQHRDLHGLNVLVDESGQPLLIDYGSVDFAPGSLDALTLELSLLFHPAAAAVRGSWPFEEQAATWTDLERYLDGCPVAPFVRECRRWAFSDTLGEQAVYANVYIYALKQLRYEDTDHDLSQAIIRGIVEHVLAE